MIDRGGQPQGDENAATSWVCRSCCCIHRLTYRYPPSPWVYCDRCSGAMATDEQLVAVAKLQFVRGHTRPDEADPTEAVEQPISIKEVATLLRRSEKGVYRLAAMGQLPGAKKIGGKWLVRPSELLRSVPEGRVPPGRSRR